MCAFDKGLGHLGVARTPWGEELCFGEHPELKQATNFTAPGQGTLG